MKAEKYQGILYVTAILFFSTFLFAAADEDLKPVPDNMKVGFESITKDDSLNFLTFLSSDELEGRDTPSRGLKISRDYITSLYKLWGVAPAGDTVQGKKIYEQAVSVVISERGENTYLEVISNGTTRRFEADVDFFLGRGGSFSGVVEAPVVFAGYGISAPELDYDDFANVDLEGKIVLVISGLPGEGRKDSPFAKPAIRRRYSRFMGSYDMQEIVQKLGAVALVNVRMPGSERQRMMFRPQRPSKYKQGDYISAPGRRVSVPELNALSTRLPSYSVSKQLADYLFGIEGSSLEEIREKIDSTLKPYSFELGGAKMRFCVEVKQTPDFTANVLGIIEGSDPELKKEYIVIGAHLDHLGITDDGYVFNGADDNASGSVGVLELAQAFSLNPVKPKRSIIFAHWTGEEKGLLGSRYFAEFPTIPIENVVACLNMDMIGRVWTADQFRLMMRRYGGQTGMPNLKVTPESAKKLFTVLLSAQSAQLIKIITDNCKSYLDMICIPRPSERMSGGSDHAPFHQKNIPSAFFFSAMHEDFHRPTDTIEKIDENRMENVIRLVYLTAFEIADLPGRLPWEEKKEEEKK